MRYNTTLASMKVLEESGVPDLSKDDYAFLTGNKIWLASERNKARRLIEMVSYGAIDILGLPRFPLPAEFIAATIIRYVHSINWRTAAVIMEGAEYTEDIIGGRDNPLRADQLFSHCLQCSVTNETVEFAEGKYRAKVNRDETV